MVFTILPLNLYSYKFKLEDGAEIKPHLPLLNNRIYDNKFESQFYRISDSNKVHFFSLYTVIYLIPVSLQWQDSLDVISVTVISGGDLNNALGVTLVVLH
jgi:hypothetical protein